MVNPWPESDSAVIAPVEEHDELRQVVRSVLAKHADHESVRAAADSELGYSQKLWRLLNDELEVSGLAVPEELGGSGYGVRELCVLLEETGAALLPEPVLTSAVLGCQALAAADDPAVVEDQLSAALRGVVVTLAPPASELPAAEKAEGGRWDVTGTLPRLAHGAAADLVVVRAATAEGPVMLLVETADVDVTSLTAVDLTRRQVSLRLASTPARLLVGPERAGGVLERLDLLARAAVAAEHAGIVGELLARTVEFATEREQFGRPIGSFQAIKHRLADVLVDRERACSAARYAAAAIDHDPASAPLAVAVASSVCADAALRAAHEAVQLHGGLGFTWEHRAHYYLRRVLGDEGLYGQSRDQRAAIADLVGV
ncbi:MAG TPA: acyl-CoA dehydrogenase family protein [Nocardioides sp.]|nr:acyl-CoA dehydrogenase family protein [Nocardioides sp.]